MYPRSSSHDSTSSIEKCEQNTAPKFRSERTIITSTPVSRQNKFSNKSPSAPPAEIAEPLNEATQPSKSSTTATHNLEASIKTKQSKRMDNVNLNKNNDNFTGVSFNPAVHSDILTATQSVEEVKSHPPTSDTHRRNIMLKQRESLAKREIGSQAGASRIPRSDFDFKFHGGTESSQFERNVVGKASSCEGMESSAEQLQPSLHPPFATLSQQPPKSVFDKNLSNKVCSDVEIGGTDELRPAQVAKSSTSKKSSASKSFLELDPLYSAGKGSSNTIQSRQDYLLELDKSDGFNTAMEDADKIEDPLVSFFIFVFLFDKIYLFLCLF